MTVVDRPDKNTAAVLATKHAKAGVVAPVLK
jgi:hypothetical protein